LRKAAGKMQPVFTGTEFLEQSAGRKDPGGNGFPITDRKV